ncbi:MAG: hypothetical protein R3B65_04035 [Candidatus Paceibacterota bacterium]
MRKKLIHLKKTSSSLLDIYRKIEVDPYSLKRDELGYYGIDPFVEKEAKNIQVCKRPKNSRELIESVEQLINQFKRSIEDNGGNNLYIEGLIQTKF